jgi:hypothetical protein
MLGQAEGLGRLYPVAAVILGLVEGNVGLAE